MSERWSHGSTRSWRKVRAAVLLRDGGLCQLRLDGCQTVATDAHHLVPWQGRPEQTPLDRLAAACGSCNRSAGEPTDDPAPTPRTRW